MKYFFLIFFLTCALVVSLSGFRGTHFSKPPIEIFPDMDRQAKVKAQVPSDFFADGRGARPPVPGTEPLGYSIPSTTIQPVTDKINVTNFKQRAYTAGPDYLNTGKMGTKWGDGIPLEVNEALLARGRERYSINCQMCHGPAGYGNGVVSNYGLNAIANYHVQRLRDMPDGEIYNTIANGKNTMMPYGSQVSLYDRWAIIAYVRALQRSQYASVADLTEEEKNKLNLK